MCMVLHIKQNMSFIFWRQLLASMFASTCDRFGIQNGSQNGTVEPPVSPKMSTLMHPWTDLGPTWTDLGPILDRRWRNLRSCTAVHLHFRRCGMHLKPMLGNVGHLRPRFLNFVRRNAPNKRTIPVTPTQRTKERQTLQHKATTRRNDKKFATKR